LLRFSVERLQPAADGVVVTCALEQLIDPVSESLTDLRCRSLQFY